MISPDEQGVAKLICLVVGLVVLYAYMAVMFIGACKTAKGDKK